VKRAQEIVIEVGGMTSAADETAVAAALRGVPGVIAASASRAESIAGVTADPSAATPERLRAAVIAAGFAAGEVRFPE